MPGGLLDVKLDVREVERMLGAAAHQVMPRATTSALNKVARSAQSLAVKMIARDIGITQKTAREHLAIHKANFRNLFSSIEARSGKRISLTRLKPRQTRKGVTYRSQQKRKLVPGAFIATMPSGGRIVVKRIGDKVVMSKGSHVGELRQPLVKLRAISIKHGFIQERINRALLKVAKERWNKVFPQEVQHFLRKYKG